MHAVSVLQKYKLLVTKVCTVVSLLYGQNVFVAA